MGWFGKVLGAIVGGVLTVVDAPLVAIFGFGLFLYNAIALGVEIYKLLKKESVLIVGPRESGKSTLARFLATGKVYDEYKRTEMIDKYETSGNVLKMEDLELSIKEIYDTPGTLYADPDLAESDETYDSLGSYEYNYLLYLFDAYKIYKQRKDYIQIISADIEFIKEKVRGKKILLVGTHEDLIMNEIKNNYNREQIVHEVSNNPVIQEFLLASKDNNLTSLPIIGSLKDETSCGELVNRLLHTMAELKKKEG